MNIKCVVLYVGDLYNQFWTKKIDRVGRGGSKKVRISLIKTFGFEALLRLLNWSRTPERDSN